MKIVSEDGSLTGASIAALLCFGLLLLFGTLMWSENYYFRIIGFCIALPVIAGAGYAGRAKALGLRSFGQYEWRSAKSSYEEKASAREDPRQH